MKNTEFKAHNRSTLSITIFALLTLILVGAVDQAQGQWTTTGNDISNTNTGNVGVGTSTPTAKLHVSASGNVMAKVQSSTAGAEFDVVSNASGAGSWGLGTGWASVGLRNLYLYDNVAGATRMLFDSSGKVGIGTTGPLYSLDVNGGINGFRAKAATTSSSDVIANFENSNGIQAIFRGNGYVGFGTASPNFNLDVNRGSTSADVILGIDANGSNSYSPMLYFRNTGTAISRIMSGADLQFQNTSNTPLLYLKSTGNLGIGTTTPGYKADVQGGALNASGGLCIAGDCKTAWSQVGSSQWTTSGSNVYYNTGNVGLGTTSPANPLTVARSGSAPWTSRPASELLQLVDRTDNTPQILFSSAFNGMNLRYTATNGISANQRLGIVTGGGLEAFVVNNDGYVGLGTTSPTSLFTSDKVVHISSGTNPHLRITDTTNTVNTFMDSENSSGNVGTASNHNFNIYSNNLTRMTVTSDGNVGIGIATPGNKLHVAGSITVDGNINAKYQDVAEWVESSQALPAGTVVVLDHTRSNQVIASSQAYDTRVAGVISSQPGITLGEKGESKVLVATTGRVKVRVDATAGPIQIGDLLVTSGKDGLAMKSQSINVGGVQIHRPGTLIGKALEPLSTGTGEILVLLSLQ